MISANQLLLLLLNDDNLLAVRLQFGILFILKYNPYFLAVYRPKKGKDGQQNLLWKN